VADTPHVKARLNPPTDLDWDVGAVDCAGWPLRGLTALTTAEDPNPGVA
jgi:hypothetical protein